MERTVIICPECQARITLWHGTIGKPNDGYGNIHVGEQHHFAVVCMAKNKGRYCEFGDLVQVKVSTKD